MKRSVGFVLGSLVVSMAALRLSCSEPPKPPADAAPDAPPRDGAKDSPYVDTTPPGSCGVEGYLLDDAYDKTCGFCYASDSKYLPPPMAWEPCDSQAEPKGMVCKEMTENWDPGQFAPDYISTVLKAWVHGKDVVTIALTRFQDPLIYRLVADADGPVHQVVIETNRSCTLCNYELGPGFAAYQVCDSEAKGKLSDYGGGALGGAVDSLRPRVFRHYHDESIHAYYASATGLLELNLAGSEIKQYDWMTGNYVRSLDSAAQNGNYAVANLWPVDDAVFSDAYIGLAFNKLRVWTLDGGARDLIGFGNDWTRGGSTVGSDGKSLAWSEGVGRSSSNKAFDQVKIMATDFTTDPPDGGKTLGTIAGLDFGGAGTVVGCGYVALQGTTVLDAGPTDPEPVQLWRIADGKRWELPNAYGAPLRWLRPIAITCTELFARVARTVDGGVIQTIARVRLDSIGPGGN